MIYMERLRLKKKKKKISFRKEIRELTPTLIRGNGSSTYYFDEKGFWTHSTSCYFG